MTAEIAIMNRAGVALAADSAVSIATSSGNTKVYDANKLFMLSKYQPVGVMIYGNADLMNVPWETIIKLYRQELGTTSYKTLREYGDSLVSFLKNSSALFHANDQETHVYLNCYRVFVKIKKQIDATVKYETLTGTPKVSTADVARIAGETIKNVSDIVSGYARLDDVATGYERRIFIKYFKIIEQAIDDVFAKHLPFPTRLRKVLRRIAVVLFSKDLFDFRDRTGNRILPFSGLVIAGFGEDDIFPAIVSYSFEGVADDLLKYKQDIDRAIGPQFSASLVPFAQKEMVLGFMYGVTPDYDQALKSSLEEMFGKYPEKFIQRFKRLSKSKKQELLSELKADSDDLLKVFWDGMNDWKKKNNADPVLDTIEILPIAELASMAESLVNLTSFKRRITLKVPETVGGPIDVAVISKGDGFVWIKRKHYFKPDSNPHFLKNYYR